MDDEGAAAVVDALPASEAEMSATKDFVRAEVNDLRADVSEQFHSQTKWIVGSAIATVGTLGALLQFLPQ